MGNQPSAVVDDKGKESVTSGPDMTVAPAPIGKKDLVIVSLTDAKEHLMHADTYRIKREAEADRIRLDFLTQHAQLQSILKVNGQRALKEQLPLSAKYYLLKKRLAVADGRVIKALKVMMMLEMSIAVKEEQLVNDDVAVTMRGLRNDLNFDLIEERMQEIEEASTHVEECFAEMNEILKLDIGNPANIGLVPQTGLNGGGRGRRVRERAELSDRDLLALVNDLQEDDDEKEQKVETEEEEEKEVEDTADAAAERDDVVVPTKETTATAAAPTAPAPTLETPRSAPSIRVAEHEGSAGPKVVARQAVGAAAPRPTVEPSRVPSKGGEIKEMNPKTYKVRPTLVRQAPPAPTPPRQRVKSPAD
jgi:hypothetical protein